MRISDWSSDVCASDLPLGEISSLEEFHALSGQLTRFLMEYKFGIDEVTTKISILQEEFAHLHDYNPIEHVLSRVKSPASIFDKMQRRGVPSTLDDIREQITDIPGGRVTCTFTIGRASSMERVCKTV